MSLDRLTIVLTAVVAAIAILGWATRGIRRMWHLMRKANQWFDQVLGEAPSAGNPGRPSLMRRIEQIEAKIDDHLKWHSAPGGRPARPAGPWPNGGGRAAQRAIEDRRT